MNGLLRKIVTQFPVDTLGFAMPGPRLPHRIRWITDGGIAQRISRMRLALLGAACTVMCSGFVAATLVRARQSDATSATGTRPKFEVASVKPCGPESEGRGGVGSTPNRIQWSPGRLTLPCQSAWVLIGWAYVRYADGRATLRMIGGGPAENTPIEGLPAWGRSERFTIGAEVPGDASKEMMMGPMMQSLLEERFKLKLHTENREVPVYDLTVAKGGLKLPQKDPDSICRNWYDPKTPARKLGDPYDCSMFVSLPGTTIPDFATSLTMQVGRPVIDKTGVPGAFAIRMTFSASGMPQNADAPSIFTALKEQLGLELTPSRGPQATIVIDHIEEPTAN